MERFKTSNALLQNSLSYVALIEYKSRVPRSRGATRTGNGRIGGGDPLSIARHVTDALKAVNERIEEFAKQAPSAGADAESAAGNAGPCSVALSSVT